MIRPHPQNLSQRFFAVFSIILAGVWNSSAADVTLTASDPGGSTSFTSAGNWNNGQPAAAGNSYFTANFTLRTPAPTTSGDNYIFGGDSLSIDAGGRFLGKIGNNVGGNTTYATVTVDNLILNGGMFEQADVDSDNSVLTVAGNVSVNAPSFIGAIGGSANGSANFDVLEFVAPISGSANLQISGSVLNGGQDRGVVKFSAANSYGGTITVTNGNAGSTAVISSAVNRALQLNNVDALSNATLNITSVVTDPVSFTSEANTGPFKVGALAGSSSQKLTDTGDWPVSLNVGGNNASTTFSGALTGLGSLTKVGSGTFTLAGTNTFSDNTTVSEGTLALAAAGSISNSPVISVARSATLDVLANAFTLGGAQSLMGGGTIRGAVSTVSGAKIYAGADGVYETNGFTDNLTFVNGAAPYMDLGTAFDGANDLITVNGNLALNNTVFHLKAPNASANLDASADYTLITVAGTISGAAAPTPVWDTPPLNVANFTIVQSGNSIKLHYAPSAPPTATISLSPATLTRNQSTLVSVTVTSSSHPITTVTLDASSIGGSATLPLIATGGNVYTNRLVFDSGTPLGTKVFVAAITDNAGLIATTPAATLNIIAASAVWSGGGANDNWSANPNWASGAAPGYAGDSVTFAGSARLTPNMDASYSVNSLTFDGTAGSFVIGGSGTLTLAGGGIVNKSVSDQTLNVSVANAGPTSFTAQSGNLTFGQAITNGGALLTINGNSDIAINGELSGSGGLDMEGYGTLTLSGTNTFTGPLAINSGAVEVAGAGLLGGGNYAGNITNMGAFTYSSSAAQTLSGIISGGGITKNGLGVLTLAGPNSYSGDTVINGGVLCVGGSGTLGNGSYNANIQNDGVFQYSSSASQTLLGAVVGSGAIIKDGTGTLTLNVANNYSGATTVRGGTLVLTPATVYYLPFGALSVSNGTLTVNAGPYGSVAMSSLSLSNNAVLTLDYDFSVGNPSTAAISAGNLSAPGTNIVINIGGIGAMAGQFPLISYTGTLPNIANFTLSGRPPGVTAALINNTVNKTIDLNVTAINPATWVPLAASDTFGASSFASAGYWADGQAPDATKGYYTMNFTLRTPADTNSYSFAGQALSIDAGGRFLHKGLDGQTITVPNLIMNGGVMDFANANSDNFTQTLAGRITFQPGVTSYLGALGGAGVAETLNIIAPISGAGNVQIGGPQVNGGQDVGNVLFAGANTYTGTTTIASGALVVNGSLGNTALTVGNSLLAGTGTIAGAVTVQSGGSIAPGIPARGALTPAMGTLTVNNTLTLSGAATMRLDRSASVNSDRLVVSNVVVNPSATLTATNMGSTNLVAGDSFTLFSVPVNGTFATVTLPQLPSADLVWTNKLAVDGTIAVLSAQAVNPDGTNVAFSVTEGALLLSWPLDHTGWTLQVQTNSLDVGLSNNWVDVQGSVGTNKVSIPINVENGAVFYRLKR